MIDSEKRSKRTKHVYVRLCDSEKKVFEKNNFSFCRRRQESPHEASFQFNDVECE
jgi:hypothetical protein